MLARYALPAMSNIVSNLAPQAQKLMQLPMQAQKLMQPPMQPPMQPINNYYQQPIQQPMQQQMQQPMLPEYASISQNYPKELNESAMMQPMAPTYQQSAYMRKPMNYMRQSRVGRKISNNPKTMIYLISGLIALTAVIVISIFVMKAYKDPTTASAGGNNGAYNSAMKDPNYNKIISAYTQSDGFGNNRNTAIFICGQLIAKYASDVNTGALQALGDADLYMILTIPDNADVYNTIMYKIIPLYLHPTDMTYDGNYSAIVNAFLKKNGVNFGKDARFVDDNMRNTAIVIIGNYITKNSITAPLQGYSDAKLFKIMTSTSLNALNANIATA